MYGMLGETKGVSSLDTKMLHFNSEELEFPRLLELFVSVLFTMHGCMYMYNVFYFKTRYLGTVFNTDLTCCLLISSYLLLNARVHAVLYVEPSQEGTECLTAECT